MGFDAVIDAGVRKGTAIWKDGSGTQPFLGLVGKEELWKERSCRALAFTCQEMAEMEG